MPEADELDDLDRRILDHLRRNARASFRVIAKALGRSTPVVAQRVRRLEAGGRIQAYTVRVAQGVDAEPREARPGDVCAECKDPCYGRSVTRTMRGKSYRFCCGVCKARFEARYRRAIRGVRGGGSALLVFGWFASFTSFGAACFGSMGGCGTGATLTPTPWDRCPPWAAHRPDTSSWANLRETLRWYRARPRSCPGHRERGATAAALAARGTGPSGPESRRLRSL